MEIYMFLAKLQRHKLLRQYESQQARPDDQFSDFEKFQTLMRISQVTWGWRDVQSVRTCLQICTHTIRRPWQYIHAHGDVCACVFQCCSNSSLTDPHFQHLMPQYQWLLLQWNLQNCLWNVSRSTGNGPSGCRDAFGNGSSDTIPMTRNGGIVKIQIMSCIGRITCM